MLLVGSEVVVMLPALAGGETYPPGSMALTVNV
jgi:hypothetical protein